MGWWGDLWGGDKGVETTSSEERKYVQLPEFPEADWARTEGAAKLKDWGTQPGYGAIPSNWGDLWNIAKDRTSQYFWGSPTDPGLVGRLKAKTARGNMAGQPAELRNIAKLGAKEGDILSDIAVKQAYAEAQESEQGRRSWMDDLFKMTQVRPRYELGSSSSTSNTKDLGGGEGWDLLSSLGSAAISAFNPLGGLASLMSPEKILPSF